MNTTRMKGSVGLGLRNELQLAQFLFSTMNMIQRHCRARKNLMGKKHRRSVSKALDFKFQGELSIW